MNLCKSSMSLTTCFFLKSCWTFESSLICSKSRWSNLNDTIEVSVWCASIDHQSHWLTTFFSLLVSFPIPMLFQLHQSISIWMCFKSIWKAEISQKFTNSCQHLLSFFSLLLLLVVVACCDVHVFNGFL